MAINTLRDFSTQWIMASLLLTCLLAFTISFMYNNNPNGLGTDADSIFEDTRDDSKALLLQSSSYSDTLLNVTSNTNPEVSDLGSRDSVATSYSAFGGTKSKFQVAKKLISWIFSGETGKMLLIVLSGVLGLLGFFFITKNIRTGD